MLLNTWVDEGSVLLRSGGYGSFAERFVLGDQDDLQSEEGIRKAFHVRVGLLGDLLRLGSELFPTLRTY